VITGALVLAAGILIGWTARSLPARRRGPRPVQPVCGCGHHYSYHDQKTRACAWATRPVVRSTSTRTEYGDPVRCPCLNYAGAEPIPSLYAPEIAGEAGE
jgi:hypothetical protein